MTSNAPAAAPASLGALACDLILKPLDNDPRDLVADDGSRVWGAYSCDPAFIARLPGSEPPLKPGWYVATAHLVDRSGHVAGPRLYIPDHAGSFSELRSVELLRKGTAYEAEFFLPRAVDHFRFDPSIYPCEFVCETIRLTRVPREQRGLVDALATLRLRLPTPQLFLQWCRKGFRVLFSRGPKALAESVYWTWVRQGEKGRSAYDDWVREYTALSDADLKAMAEAARALPRQPLISLITPVYNTQEAFLRAVIDSVMRQAYPNWELCLADDASTAPHVRQVLEEYRARDSRIKVAYREKNGHISAASNTALELATGEFVALLDHDDELPPDALYWVARELNEHPDAALIYSDEDKLDFDGKRATPYFKCDWNYDLFLSHNLITHLGVYRADVVRAIGGFREGYEGAQDYDLALRFIERIEPVQIRHIPRALYHWRMLRGSTSIGAEQKNYAAEKARLAIEDHLKRIKADATVETIEDMAVQRVRYRVPAEEPLVSIIVPTRNGRKLVEQCVESIRAKTTYRNYEIVLVDNGSDEQESIDYFRALESQGKVRVVHDPGAFNFSRINNDAAKQARGEYLVFLNNDTEVITPEWLTELVSHAQRPQIGAVGAKLWYPNDTVQHAGLVLVAGVAGHAHLGRRRGDHGYFSRASLIQSIAAVTGACMCIRRKLFEEVGGFDEVLAVAFNDVDLCLRLHSKGYRNIYTPYAELYHHESASRGYEDTVEKMARFKVEVEILAGRWMPLLMNDPYYNPNLALVGDPFTLARPPRVAQFRAPAAAPAPEPPPPPAPEQAAVQEPATAAPPEPAATSELNPAVAESSPDMVWKKARKEIVLATIDRNGLGIEIGPSHDPIAPKREGFRVHVIDHMSREQLVEKYRIHPVQVERIEEVDFVWSGQSYLELIGTPKHYDWIIASNVIEHTPDLIAFLEDCDSILKDDGVLSLVIPDKRYCFDRFRPITGLARVLDAHFAGNKIHSPGAVAEYFMNVAGKGHELCWDAQTKGDYVFIHSAHQTIAGIREIQANHSYFDIHNWCFVPHSFRLLLGDLYSLGYTKLREVQFRPTQGYEFFVTLGRHGAGPDKSRYDMLRAIDEEIASTDAPEGFEAVKKLVRDERLRRREKH
jgi:GT2 family glycosyltransferase/predicted SAM-dependent methyltransferase